MILCTGSRPTAYGPETAGPECASTRPLESPIAFPGSRHSSRFPEIPLDLHNGACSSRRGHWKAAAPYGDFDFGLSEDGATAAGSAAMDADGLRRSVQARRPLRARYLIARVLRRSGFVLRPQTRRLSTGPVMIALGAGCSFRWTRRTSKSIRLRTSGWRSTQPWWRLLPNALWNSSALHLLRQLLESARSIACVWSRSRRHASDSSAASCMAIECQPPFQIAGHVRHA